MGRFDEERWRRYYQDFFDTNELSSNDRGVVKVEVSEQGDGGLAVVDIDTLWRRRDGASEMHWKGRVCKVYALVRGDWKLTMHTGALEYRPDASAATRAWIERWASAWPAGNADAVGALYAEGAVFYSHPFREPEVPSDYATWAFADQTGAQCRFGEPIVSGDRAAVDWWATIASTDGSVETIAGTSLLRFGDEGLVVEQRDVWASVPGTCELPDWAA